MQKFVLPSIRLYFVVEDASAMLDNLRDNFLYNDISSQAKEAAQRLSKKDFHVFHRWQTKKAHDSIALNFEVKLKEQL